LRVRGLMLLTPWLRTEVRRLRPSARSSSRAERHVLFHLGKRPFNLIVVKKLQVELSVTLMKNVATTEMVTL